jgi:predicted metal-binding membrane protein
MAALTVLFMLEKAPPGGEWVSRIAGATLTAAGAGILRWALAR